MRGYFQGRTECLKKKRWIGCSQNASGIECGQGKEEEDEQRMRDGGKIYT
jgi:hypothetical protein